MSAEQTPGRPAEQEWAEAILARLVTVSRLPRWMQAPALGRDMTPLAELVASALAPLIDREREAAKAEGMAAVAGPVLALADWTDTKTTGLIPLDRLHAAIPTDATEALARLKAQWQAEALRDGAALIFDVFANPDRRRPLSRAAATSTDFANDEEWARQILLDEADRIAREAQQDGGDRG